MNDMNAIPRVSVIIPCYNEPEEIFRKSIESVINQTLEEIEIIIILDNPDNKELELIVLEYAMKYDNILIFSPGKNLGRGEARNFGISGANGEYIAIHDADDIDTPERLEEQLDYMKKNKDIGVVFSEVENVDEKGNSVNTPGNLCARNTDTTSFFERTVNHPTMFVRSEIMLQCRYPNQDFGEDLDVWMQIFKKNQNFGYIGRVHTQYLTPSFSPHSNFVKKMKGWKLGSIKSLIRHLGYFKYDPLIYIKICVALNDYLVLCFGEKAYMKYRNLLAKILRISN